MVVTLYIRGSVNINHEHKTITFSESKKGAGLLYAEKDDRGSKMSLLLAEKSASISD